MIITVPRKFLLLHIHQNVNFSFLFSVAILRVVVKLSNNLTFRCIFGTRSCKQQKHTQARHGYTDMANSPGASDFEMEKILES